MIELIVGEKGKGKTKMLMAKANNDIKVIGGNIVYMDQNNKHMYELSNRVRLINVPDYNVKSMDMFLGFIYGIVSSDSNLDCIFLDNFMTIACIETIEDTDFLVKELEKVSNTYEIDFVIGISKTKQDLTEYLQGLVTVAL
ncbi:MAG: twitching motility protein PilT [Lachnospiraceae bacterium]